MYTGKLLFAIGLLVSGLLFHACTPPLQGDYYSIPNPKKAINQKNYGEGNMKFAMQPNHLEAPMPGRKGDVYLKGGIGNGSNLCLAMATGNKFGFYTRISGNRFEEEYSESADVLVHVNHYENDMLTNSYDFMGKGTLQGTMKHEQVLFELAGGYFNRVKGNFHHETWTGVAFGRATTHQDIELLAYGAATQTNLREYRDLVQYFLQYNAGFRGGAAELSFMNRLEASYFYLQHFDLEPGYESYEMKRSTLSFRPGIRTGLGNQKIRLFAQYEWLIPLVKGDVSWKKNQFSGGLILRLNYLK